MKLEKSWSFLEKVKSIDLSTSDSLNLYAGSIRGLLNMALQISVFTLDCETVLKILAFCRKQLQILCIEPGPLDLLIYTENFKMIKALVDSNV